MNKNITPPIDFAVGGQAVIEGVMMRSANYNIVSVRSADGKIKTQQEFYQNITRRYHYLNIPILRGVINMFEMLFIGTKALNFSSQIALADLEKDQPAKEEIKSSIPAETKQISKTKEIISLVFSLVFALAMSLFLFKFLPLWITDFVSKKWSLLEQNYLYFNLFDGILKTGFFVSYIAILSLLPDVKRVFRYHGAEHKSIMAYEHGLELTVENAQKQTRFHPRCGTSFILIVFLISIFIFTLVPRFPDLITNFFVRMAFLPLVAGLSYELLKMSAKYSNNLFFRIISKPGLWMQRLTTQEPDASMLEVSLNSLKLALEAEQKYAQSKND